MGLEPRPPAQLPTHPRTAQSPPHPHSRRLATHCYSLLSAPPPGPTPPAYSCASRSTSTPAAHPTSTTWLVKNVLQNPRRAHLRPDVVTGAGTITGLPATRFRRSTSSRSSSSGSSLKPLGSGCSAGVGVGWVGTAQGANAGAIYHRCPRETHTANHTTHLHALQALPAYEQRLVAVGQVQRARAQPHACL